MEKEMDILTGMLSFAETKMKMVDQVGRDDEEYNNLYLAMRTLVQDIRTAMKAQYIIDRRMEDARFWDGMKGLRNPKDDMQESLNVKEKKVEKKELEGVRNTRRV